MCCLTPVRHVRRQIASKACIRQRSAVKGSMIICKKCLAAANRKLPRIKHAKLVLVIRTSYAHAHVIIFHQPPSQTPGTHPPTHRAHRRRRQEVAVIRAALSNPVSRNYGAVRQLRVSGGPAWTLGALSVGHELARAGFATRTAVVALFPGFHLVVAACRFVRLLRTFGGGGWVRMSAGIFLHDAYAGGR